jgi:hypothetical protein
MKQNLELIARLYDLVAEMNVIALQLRHADIAVAFGRTTPATREDPLNEKGQAVIEIRLRTGTDPLQR